MRLLKGKREEEGKTEDARPAAEFEQYQQALAAQTELAGRINGLQARLGSLVEQADSVQEQLHAARDRKKVAITQLALGEITQEAYDTVKAEIAKLSDLLEENTEQAAIVERTLNGLSRETIAAAEKVRGARFNVIHAYINQEAEEIRGLIGEDRILKLVCLAAQTGIGDYGQQLVKVFGPAPGLDVRQEMNIVVLRDIFGEE